ncbi:HesB/IscA family protein [candidate division KSB1 bacterium]
MSDVSTGKALPTVSITENAANEIKRVMAEQNIGENAGLKVGVAGGGCSGLSYTMDFAQEPSPGDRVFEKHGVRLFIDVKSFLYIQGTELDFSGGLNGRGFVFTNPNATRTCGCGSSFSV